jgi:hypothetical protein
MRHYGQILNPYGLTRLTKTGRLFQLIDYARVHCGCKSGNLRIMAV